MENTPQASNPEIETTKSQIMPPSDPMEDLVCDSCQ
jgi:hypothetical protein